MDNKYFNDRLNDIDDAVDDLGTDMYDRIRTAVHQLRSMRCETCIWHKRIYVKTAECESASDGDFCPDWQPKEES